MSEGVRDNITWNLPSSFPYATNHATITIGGTGSKRFYGYITALRVWGREKYQVETQFDTYRRLYSGYILLYVWNFNEGSGNITTEFMLGNTYLHATTDPYSWSPPIIPPPICGHHCNYDGLRCKCIQL